MRSRGIARVAGIVLLAAFLTPAAKAQTVTGAAIAKALGQRRVKGRLPFWVVTKLVVKEEKGSVPFSAPTNGGLLDTAGTTVSKMGIDSAPVVALRNQQQAIQASGNNVYWVAHSRGGEDFAQAVSGASGLLDMNKVVFHAGANTSFMTNPILVDKEIARFNGGYRDSPNDLVPQYVGLRALTSPLNFIYALIASPCIFFCSAENSPHTLPYDWPNLLKE